MREAARIASRMRKLILSLAAGLSVSGCKTSCRQLSEVLCDCTSGTSERTDCLQRAAKLEAEYLVATSYDQQMADRAVCEELMDTCDCRLIDTQSGKENCGLAVRAADGGP